MRIPEDATSMLFLPRTKLSELIRVFMGNVVESVLIQKGRSFATVLTVESIRGRLIVPLARFCVHRWAHGGTIVVPTLPDAKCTPIIQSRLMRSLPVVFSTSSVLILVVCLK